MDSSGPREWAVYVLRCENGSLYTGVAKDVDARFAQHKSGKGAAYTRIYAPIELVYRETDLTRSEALVKEAAIKRLSKKSKEKLICGRS